MSLPAGGVKRAGGGIGFGASEVVLPVFAAVGKTGGRLSGRGHVLIAFFAALMVLVSFSRA